MECGCFIRGCKGGVYVQFWLRIKTELSHGLHEKPVRSLAAACPFRDVGLLHNLYVVGVGVLVVVAVDIVHRRLAVIFAGISNGV